MPVRHAEPSASERTPDCSHPQHAGAPVRRSCVPPLAKRAGDRSNRESALRGRQNQSSHPMEVRRPTHRRNEPTRQYGGRGASGSGRVRDAAHALSLAAPGVTHRAPFAALAREQVRGQRMRLQPARRHADADPRTDRKRDARAVDRPAARDGTGRRGATRGAGARNAELSSSGAIFDRLPRQPSTRFASSCCSPAENPGMSALCRMYAPCLWKPVCDTENPVSCSSAAHRGRWTRAVGSGLGAAFS